MKFLQKIKIFIKPLKKRFINILKAPYKGKLSRNQVHIQRYNLLISFYLNYNDLKITNLNSLIYFNKKLSIIFNFLESNFIYKQKLVLKYYIFYKNFLSMLK